MNSSIWITFSYYLVRRAIKLTSSSHVIVKHFSSLSLTLRWLSTSSFYWRLLESWEDDSRRYSGLKRSTCFPVLLWAKCLLVVLIITIIIFPKQHKNGASVELVKCSGELKTFLKILTKTGSIDSHPVQFRFIYKGLRDFILRRKDPTVSRRKPLTNQWKKTLFYWFFSKPVWLNDLDTSTCRQKSKSTLTLEAQSANICWIPKLPFENVVRNISAHAPEQLLH